MGFGCAAGSSGWLNFLLRSRNSVSAETLLPVAAECGRGKTRMVTRTTTAPHTSSFAAKSIVGRLILVSNRGPVTHELEESGRIRRMDADGGVAVALASVARSQPVTWIAGACSFADRIVALTG